MNRLLYMALPVLLASCTFDPDLGGKFFPCMQDGTCPSRCVCLEGQICVPDGPDMGPKDCAWCEDGQTVCREGQDVWCAVLDSDPENCGSCGNVCQLANATADCREGTCVISGCLEYYQDCDQLDETGCESCTEADPNNCGECGVVCDDPPPSFCEEDTLIIHLDTGDCVDGQCKYQSSPRPCEFGCDKGACKNDPCLEVTCNQHQHCENGLCVCDEFYADCDTNNQNGCETYLSDVENCGECGFSCGDNSVCVNGTCDCANGFGNCNDNWGDGCETDILFNEQNCGTCNLPCDPGLTCCDGVCVDTNTDRGNCGGCMTFCIGMTECCGGTCIDTQLDPENCGECGNRCGPPAETCCYASCVDISSDSNHCGECNHNCASNIPCHEGTCGAEGIYCGNTTCDFYTEECCYGANGIGCYPAGECSTRIVECDDDSDCGDLTYCCLVDSNQYITKCNSMCSINVCSSSTYCSDTDPGTPYCCAGDYDGQTVNTCSPEYCQ